MSQLMATIVIISLVVLIVFSAFFSAAETAYSSVRRSKIEAELKQGRRTSLLIKKHYKSFGWTFATILICNNIVNILASALATYMVATLIGASVASAFIGTLIITPLIIIFGEIIPKMFARKFSYGYLRASVYILEALNWLLLPITFPLRKMSLSSSITNTEGEIQSIVNLAYKEGVLEKREARLVQNALDLDSRVVDSIKTPTKKMRSIDFDSTVAQALEIFQKSGYSRLPVKGQGKFQGVLMLKDVAFNKSGSIVPFIKSAPYISKNILLVKALEILRKERRHLAFVIANKQLKKVVGIITIEDIVEELIGEIDDEHDKTQAVREIGLYKYLASGSARMALVEEITKEKFVYKSKDQTLKQWLNSRVHRSIRKNLKYTYKNRVKFKVISNRKRSKMLVEITFKDTSSKSGKG